MNAPVTKIQQTVPARIYATDTANIGQAFEAGGFTGIELVETGSPTVTIKGGFKFPTFGDCLFGFTVGFFRLNLARMSE